MTESRQLTAENSRLATLVNARKAAEKRGDQPAAEYLETQIERRLHLIGNTPGDVPPIHRTPSGASPCSNGD